MSTSAPQPLPGYQRLTLFSLFRRGASARRLCEASQQVAGRLRQNDQASDRGEPTGVHSLPPRHQVSGLRLRLAVHLLVPGHRAGQAEDALRLD